MLSIPSDKTRNWLHWKINVNYQTLNFFNELKRTAENIIIDTASCKVALVVEVLANDNSKAEKITQPYTRLRQ